MTTQHRTTLPTASVRGTTAALDALDALDALGNRDGQAGDSPWAVTTTLVAWCGTCGTDVEFAAPTGGAPADLAAEERGCVWCGEALVVSFGRTTNAAAAASVA